MPSTSSNIGERRKAELARLAKRDGTLQAEAVVAFAKNKRTALHSAFEWDDRKASHEYRLIQARKLIVSVTILMDGNPEPVQAFVSLKEDRQKVGGGYRSTARVLTNRELRAALLEQALQEFEHFRRKYQDLQELASVFAAADRVRARTQPRPSRPVGRRAARGRAARAGSRSS
jgi:hypothetical protein